MPADPEHHWTPEPTSDFLFPSDSQIDLLRDFFSQRFRRTLCQTELEFISGLVGDFLGWSELRPARREARIAALQCVRLLAAIDEWMSSSRDPGRAWSEVAFGLGLPSVLVSSMTQRELATAKGLTPMAISKSVHKFLRIVELKPAFSNNGLQLNF